MITIKLSRRHGVHKFYVIHKTVTYTFTTSLQHYIISYMAKLSSGKVSRNTIHRKKIAAPCLLTHTADQEGHHKF